MSRAKKPIHGVGPGLFAILFSTVTMHGAPKSGKISPGAAGSPACDWCAVSFLIQWLWCLLLGYTLPGPVPPAKAYVALHISLLQGGLFCTL